MAAGQGFRPIEAWVQVITAQALSNTVVQTPRQIIGGQTRGGPAGATGGRQGPCYGILIRARVTGGASGDSNVTVSLWSDSADPAAPTGNFSSFTAKKNLTPIMEASILPTTWEHFWITPDRDDVQAFKIGFVAAGASTLVLDVWRRRYVLDNVAA